MCLSIPVLATPSSASLTPGQVFQDKSAPTTEQGLRSLAQTSGRFSTPRPAAVDQNKPRKHRATTLTLVSHHLCPYVQRAAIALAEKAVPFERCWVDLADKPSWFNAISPLGKVPLLIVSVEGYAPRAIFESAVILEYLEETQPNPLHPTDPVARARERAWMESGSVVLNAIAALYNAPDTVLLDTQSEKIRTLIDRLEDELAARNPGWSGPYFRGLEFGLVDAVFGPVFRYFDVFENVAGLHLLSGLERIAHWRHALANRPSVHDAIDAGYAERLERFLLKRGSAISERVRHQSPALSSCRP